MLNLIATDIIIEVRPGLLPEVPVLVEAERLIIDLSAITMADSRLIARLIQITRVLSHLDVRIRHAAKRVRVQFRMLGIDRILNVKEV